jgi:hypothetical protein
MKKLLQPDFRSIALGTAIYVVFYVIVTIYMNATATEYPRNAVAKALLVFLTYFPFLAAGYNTALRSHPAGVFNSILVGVIVGVLTVQYLSSHVGNALPAHASAMELATSLAAGLVICSLGGVLGEVKRHYIRDTA